MVVTIVFDALLVLVVARGTQRLPIVVIPKEATIAFVWNDVINHLCTLYAALFCTPDA
jgi:hypothetical protein